MSSRARDQKRDRIQKPEDYATLGGVIHDIPGMPGLVVDLGALWKELDAITD